jgi:magnesium-transporting ATPase (P-type)
MLGHHIHVLNSIYVSRNLGKYEDINEILSMPREKLEAGLQFLALIMFRNELKPDSRGAIESLKAGEVGTPQRKDIIFSGICLSW